MYTNDLAAMYAISGSLIQPIPRGVWSVKCPAPVRGQREFAMTKSSLRKSDRLPDYIYDACLPSVSYGKSINH